MDKKRIILYMFIIFLLTRWFYTGTLSLIYTIITFLIPLIVLVKRKDYHLFAFAIEDTIPSLMINIGYALLFSFVLFIIGFAANEFDFVIFFGLDLILILRILFISFLQELLFRYFLQRNLINYHGKLIGILITSFVSSVLVFPPITMSLTFFFMGLIIGWVFNKTNDIYGATIAHFLIQTVSIVML